MNYLNKALDTYNTSVVSNCLLQTHHKLARPNLQTKNIIIPILFQFYAMSLIPQDHKARVLHSVHCTICRKKSVCREILYFRCQYCALQYLTDSVCQQASPWKPMECSRIFFWQNTMGPSMTHPATRCIILLHDLQNKIG